MSAADLHFCIENDDGTTEWLNAFKVEGNQMWANIVGDEQKLITRLSYILELLSTKNYQS